MIYDIWYITGLNDIALEEKSIKEITMLEEQYLDITFYK